jgi:hypothetical protein
MMGGYLEGYILTEKIFIMRGVYICLVLMPIIPRVKRYVADKTCFRRLEGSFRVSPSNILSF